MICNPTPTRTPNFAPAPTPLPLLSPFSPPAWLPKSCNFCIEILYPGVYNLCPFIVPLSCVVHFVWYVPLYILLVHNNLFVKIFVKTVLLLQLLFIIFVGVLLFLCVYFYYYFSVCIICLFCLTVKPGGHYRVCPGLTFCLLI